MFIFLFLLIPLTANAVVTCEYEQESQCKSHAGCEWYNNTYCRKCPAPDSETGQGYYCTNGVKRNCPEPFINSIEGATGIHECHKTISCGGTNVELSCSDLTAQGCPTPRDDGDYSVQWRYSPDLNPNAWLNKKAFLWLDSDRVYPTADLPNGYHIEAHPKYIANTIHVGGEWSLIENSVDFECVPNSRPCADFNADDTFPPVDCSQHNGSAPDCSATQGCGWVQYDQSTYKCFFINDIGVFPKSVTKCTNGTISGNAIWISKDDDDNHLGYGYWDVSGCYCNNASGTELFDERCYGSSTFHVDRSGAAVTIVHTTKEHIIFDNEEPEELTCARCFEDGRIQGEKYFTKTGDGYENGKVSHCKVAAGNYFSQRGYYRNPAHTGYCGGATDWTDLSDNPCPRVACNDVGTTTNELLPIKEDTTPIEQICVYGDQTQICDGDGSHCVTLQSQGSLTDWEML